MHPALSSARRRAAVGATLAATALIATACGSSGGGSSNPDSSTSAVAAVATIPSGQLASGGTLTVCGGVGVVPYDMYGTGKNLTGIEVDLAAAMAGKLGLKSKVVNTPFDTIIEALQSHKCDVIMSTQDIKPERRAIITQISYINVATGILTAPGNPKKIGDPKTDPNSLCGTKFAVEIGSSSVDTMKQYSADCTKAGKSPITITTAQDNNALVLLLTTKKVDAFVGTSSTAEYIEKTKPGTLEAGAVLDLSHEGIGVAKDRNGVRDAIVTALKSVNTDGTYATILQKYGVSASESIPTDIGTY